MAWGEHTGNDARVVGVTHDLSMPQMSYPDVTPPLSRSHTFPYKSQFLLPNFMKHTYLLSLYIWQCLFLAIANYESLKIVVKHKTLLM